MKSILGKHHKTILTIVFVIFTISIVTYLLQKYGLEKTIEIIQAQGVGGMLVYVVYVSLSVIFSPLNSLLVKPVALFAYGFWISVFLAFIGSVIGGTSNYYLAKIFGRPLIRKLAGAGVLKKVDEFTDIVGWKAFLLLRIVGVNYFDYVSYAAGLTKMGFTQFALITYPIEFIWKIAVFYIISRAITNHTASFITLMIFIYLVSIYSGYFIWKQYRKRNKNYDRS